MPRSALEQIAERRVPGSGPINIHPVATGLVNRSCRVVRDGNSFSMRVVAEGATDLGLDRAWECRVLERAATAGLAPRVECCAPEEGILVAAWANGRTWSAEEACGPEHVDQMAELLRRVHALPIPQPPRVMSAGAWISHYAAAAARRKAGVARSAALRANAMTHLGRLGATPAPPAVLCHSDLHRLNIVDDRPGGGLILLDWEYAHVADGFWDLAGWIANNDWTEDTAARLLRSYLRRAAFPAESARLGALRWLYDYVCLQWSEIYLNQRAGPDSDEVDARAERLAERLGCGSGGRAG